MTSALVVSGRLGCASGLTFDRTAIDRRMIGGSWMLRKLSSLGGVRISWALTNI